MKKIYQKHKVPITISIRFSQKDLDFMDEHRGNLSRNVYLSECMYKMSSKDVENIIEKEQLISELRAEIQDLKKQIMFSQPKNKSSPTHVLPQKNEDGQLIKWYNELKLQENISKFGRSVNWNTLFDRHIDFLSNYFSDPKSLAEWALDHHKHNGHSNIYVGDN